MDSLKYFIYLKTGKLNENYQFLNFNFNYLLPLIDISILAREESNVVIGSQTIPTAYGVTVPVPKLNPFGFDS